ncbi:hypothetical protein [Curtobacterium sp. AG1037]|uniref:hypothetical protein n=1 Tax=Curtobacterium sp. AG1037 TaxID=2183990 RepID=UPI0015F03401|nr:hypothetical protein [Curtobacterium sp. AG1037]
MKKVPVSRLEVIGWIVAATDAGIVAMVGIERVTDSKIMLSIVIILGLMSLVLFIGNGVVVNARRSNTSREEAGASQGKHSAAITRSGRLYDYVLGLINPTDQGVIYLIYGSVALIGILIVLSFVFQ